MMNEVRKAKRQSLLLIIMFILVLIGIISFIFFCIKNKDRKDYDYLAAKGETITFLKNNINELESNCNKVIEENKVGCIKYNDLDYCYGSFDKKNYVSIDINSQGFLGGQYWGLIYSKEDLLDNEDIYIYDEKREIDHGNNIFIKEKLMDNWYFYYDDYDGKVDIIKIK